MVLYIILTIVAIIAYLTAFHYLKEWIDGKVGHGASEDKQDDFYHDHLSALQYIDGEHDWTPKYNLEHKGVKVFNIPFVPEPNEVFYLENEYDEDV